MRLRLLRHATLLVETAGVRLLVDPMLGPPASQPPVPETPDPRPNPLVPLPVDPLDAVRGVAATLVTHLHNDHFDVAALGVVPRDRPVLCQPRDQPMLARAGLSATVVDGPMTLGALRIARTGGRHGTGAIGVEMGDVSGFVIAADGEPTVYVAGDTVWCDEVEAALAAHRPDVVVVNAGAARFIHGDPITMDVADVVAVCAAAPDAFLVAVHMEAMNHCGLTRNGLHDGLAAHGVAGRVAIPADGETLDLSFGG
jgi:L-ascorbate metabolism protein UlaG (beta-lactamase superfamily)